MNTNPAGGTRRTKSFCSSLPEPAVAVLLLPALVALSVSARPGRADDSAAPRPNLIVIMSDDMGFSDIGCYGGEIRTPHLDALAAGGLRFTQFYNCARCCPTRASLLSGLYPHQAGMGHMTGAKYRSEGYAGDLSRNCLTIAEALAPAGYRSYMTGKWHVSRHEGLGGITDNWPLQRGFSRFYGTIRGAGSFFDPTTLCRDNTLISPQNDPEYRPATYYYTDAISDNAVKFIGEHGRDHATQPFFLYVAYTAAHWPMHALPEDIARYRGMYDGGYEPIRQARFERAKQMGLIDSRWQLTPTAERWDDLSDKAWEARCMEVYAAMIDRMDQGIGRMIAELKRQKRLENTLILFLQDNGGCAELVGRTSNAERIQNANYRAFGREDLQPAIVPPMQTRDGRAVRSGPGVMPGPEDTYVAYGLGWANVSNTPFREYKHWVHEGGISSPLIAHWPQGIAPDLRNRFVHSPSHLIDIMATCVDLAGAKYPAERDGLAITPLEGTSLRPAFAARSLERKQPLFFEHEGNRAVRDGQWKLVAKGPAGAWELYNMSVDRTETTNLADRDPERVRQLVAQWEAWAHRSHVLPWVWTPAYEDQRAR
ncbi:MAG: arylsulfatase [Planctomycetaceae bacterium]